MPQDLPDTDGMLNKTDPYLRVKVVGNPTKKTPTIKGSLNRVFKKDNSFVFTGGHLGGGDLHGLGPPVKG